MSGCFRILCTQVVLVGCLATCTNASAATETPSAADIQRQNLAINNALKIAGPIKTQVEEYRRHHDNFPASNAEASLGPPASYAGPDVRQIAIDHDGIIQITLTASSGVDSGVIVLTPKLPKNTDDYVVEWKCASPSYSTISDATLGLCEYTKVP